MRNLRVSLFVIGLLCLAARGVAADAKTFRAGAAQVDVTPTTFPVVVSGGFTERTADVAHDRLMSRALVLDDGQTRLAIAVIDNLMMTRAMLDEVKDVAARETGIPADRMLISATHTHSAPSVMGALGSRADAAYSASLPGQIVKSIVLAHENLAPAKIGWAVVRDYAHNHCRRWVFRPDRMARDPFGDATVRAMMHPAHQSPDHIGPAGPADPDLTLLSVQTADGQPMAALANYAMHYKGSSPVSSDFCGRFGDVLAERIGATNVTPRFVGIMSQGTSGDSMWLDYTRPANDPGLESYTQAVVDQAKRAYDSIAYHAWVPLAMAEARLVLRRRVPDETRLAWARGIADGIQGRLPQNQAEVYAMEAIYLHEQPEVELKLQAIRIGDLGIAAVPNEVFGITGMKIKAQSPLSPTFNIELANGAEGYIPPPEQHCLGGYTTWPARTAGLEVQAEPQIVETLLALFEQVSGARRALREPPADAYVEAVMRAQPRAFWRLDEFAGALARDATGQGYTGTYEPGVAFYLPGRTVAALEFAEQTANRAAHFAGGRMQAGSGGLGDRYSIELWFWNGLPAEARAITGYLCALGTGTEPAISADQLSLAGTAVGKPVLVFSNGSDTQLVGTTPLALRTWYHVVLVRDGRGISVYLNGSTAPEIAGEAELLPAALPSLIFAGRHDRENTLEGKLDDIAVYARPLTAAEIASHYAAAAENVPAR
jgi:hypothetical protein